MSQKPRARALVVAVETVGGTKYLGARGAWRWRRQLVLGAEPGPNPAPPGLRPSRSCLITIPALVEEERRRVLGRAAVRRPPRMVGSHEQTGGGADPVPTSGTFGGGMRTSKLARSRSGGGRRPPSAWFGWQIGAAAADRSRGSMRRPADVCRGGRRSSEIASMGRRWRTFAVARDNGYGHRSRLGAEHLHGTETIGMGCRNEADRGSAGSITVVDLTRRQHVAGAGGAGPVGPEEKTAGNSAFETRGPQSATAYHARSR